jgi:hypothetical protein
VSVLTLKNWGAEPVVLSVLAPPLSLTIPQSDSITVGLPQELIDKLVSQNTKSGLTHISDVWPGFRDVSYSLWSD